MAIYACKECDREEFVPRRYRYHLGPHARCPSCGTFRVVKLKEPDRIDPTYGGFLDFLERLAGGGKLFHCCYCRVQFHDRRRLATAPDPTAAVGTGSEIPGPQNTAPSNR
jgi:DNA-directed RNA polymerase subunit RPC12/RpoP